MKTICRLSWSIPNMEYNEFSEIAKKVESYLVENNLINNHFRIGNFCINGIPANSATEIQSKFNATHIDNQKEILERDDIKAFTIGDKVKVFFENAWSQISEDKGTVYSIEGETITIKKYRSKTKGYTLQVGQVGKIELGW
jgi:hypothetical protein